MTGRDLIIYILQNNLEDKPVFEDGKFIGFLTTNEAALKMNVGPATIKALIMTGQLTGVEVKDGVYIPGNFEGSNKNG